MLGKRKKLVLFIMMAILMTSVLTGYSLGKTSDKQEPVTITFMAFKEPTQTLQNLIKSFEEKYPGIKVNMQVLPAQPDQQHNTYVTALSAGDSSMDALTMDVIWTAEFASAGWIMPLDKRFKKTSRDQYLPAAIESVTYNGHVYAVPRYTHSSVLYYRKDIIAQAPKTWGELARIAKENIGKNGIKYGFVFQGNQYEGMVCNALEYIFSNGGKVIDGKKVVVNSPKAIQGLQYMIDFIKIAPPGVTTYGEEDARNVFQQGDAIFMRNWPYAWPLLNGNESPVKGKIGIAPLPVGANGINGVPVIGGNNLAISKYSKHPNETWKFIEFLSSADSQKYAEINSGRMPARIALYSDKDLLNKDPFLSDLYNVFSKAKSRPVSPYYSKMSDSMQIYFHKALTGEMTAHQAIENVQKELEKILKNK